MTSSRIWTEGTRFFLVSATGQGRFYYLSQDYESVSSNLYLNTQNISDVYVCVQCVRELKSLYFAGSVNCNDSYSISASIHQFEVLRFKNVIISVVPDCPSNCHKVPTMECSGASIGKDASLGKGAFKIKCTIRCPQIQILFLRPIIR